MNYQCQVRPPEQQFSYINRIDTNYQTDQRDDLFTKIVKESDDKNSIQPFISQVSNQTDGWNFTQLTYNSSTPIDSTAYNPSNLQVSNDKKLELTQFAGKSQKIESKVIINERLQQQSQSQSDSDDESYNQYSVEKNKKIAKSKTEQYPTKNFLQTFKSSFITFLVQYFENSYHFYTHPVIHQINSKKCINLNDYQQLFNVDEFRPILELYFKQKVIYRDLLNSRVKFARKRYYFQKVKVLQEGFRLRKLTKIN